MKLEPEDLEFAEKLANFHCLDWRVTYTYWKTWKDHLQYNPKMTKKRQNAIKAKGFEIFLNNQDKFKGRT